VISPAYANAADVVLRVIHMARIDDSDMLRTLIQEADELVAILTAIVKNTKAGGI